MIGALGFTAVSCSRNSDGQVVNNNTGGQKAVYPVVYDLQNNFKFENNRFQIPIRFDASKPLPSTDVVLVYRRNGVDNGANVWQPIPRTMYLQQGDLDYDFDFTVRDVTLYAAADFDIMAQNADFQNQYMNNQVFRLVFVPASATSKIKLDYSNYDEVAKFYNIKEKDIMKL